MFNLEDLKYVERNDDLIKNLIHYKGALPIVLIPLLNNDNYLSYIQKQSDDVWKQYSTYRRDFKKSSNKDKFCEEQFNKWIEQNPKFDKLLNDLVRKDG